MIDLREWPLLRLVSFNVGPARHLPELFASAIAFQEAGDQWDAGEIIAQAIDDGYAVISGPEPGQSSTPLAYRPDELRLIKTRRILLAERQAIGPGAGPDTLKQKWMVGGLFEHLPTGRRVWIFCVHYVASQQNRKRRLVALAMTNRMVWFIRGLVFAVFVLGDFNQKPTGRTLRALRRAGLRVNQLVLRLLGTHGRRAIDMCWWTARRWIRLLHHYVVKTGSDHRADVSEFALRPRRRRRKVRR